MRIVLTYRFRHIYKFNFIIDPSSCWRRAFLTPINFTPIDNCFSIYSHIHPPRQDFLNVFVSSGTWISAQYHTTSGYGWQLGYLDLTWLCKCFWLTQITGCNSDRSSFLPFMSSSSEYNYFGHFTKSSQICLATIKASCIIQNSRIMSITLNL